MLKILFWIAGILGGILLLLLVLLILAMIPRVRVAVDKKPSEPLRLVLGYGIIRIPILPLPKKKEKTPAAQKTPPPKKKTKKKPEKEKKGSALSIKELDFGEAICLALDMLLDLRNRLVIHRLRVDVMIATGDAAKTGVLLGNTAAVSGMILPLLEQNFVISDFGIYVDGDFQAETPSTRAMLGITISLRPIHLPLILLKYSRRLLAIWRALRSDSKKSGNNSEIAGNEEIHTSNHHKKENAV